jgi:hypothetical protein
MAKSRKMTKAEREVLSALSKLGRRSWHSGWQVTKARLWMVRRPETNWSGAYLANTIGTPAELNQLSISQYQRVTEKWLDSFVRRGLAEIREETAEIGGIVVHFGDGFRVTKEGQKVARMA